MNAYIYVPGEDIKALWATWTDALAARCEHELACMQAGGGCDTRGEHCLIGWDLAEIEQAAHTAYHLRVSAAGVAA